MADVEDDACLRCQAENKQEDCVGLGGPENREVRAAKGVLQAVSCSEPWWILLSSALQRLELSRGLSLGIGDGSVVFGDSSKTWFGLFQFYFQKFSTIKIIY
ncbi:RING-box protein 2 isoform X3 [Bubalus kerabau]|uniref:RING-box protein 2 isoform X3 n=1 Tax=Bubalus carabanensis TaxID=3119969 RepID=UPI00244E7821|nr:RING-box protein 2 isoform X3 [Bubalus carabanensis]